MAKVLVTDACDLLTSEHPISVCPGPPCRRHYPGETPIEAIRLPLGPLCKRCGHEPCPMCQTWCDDLDCKQCDDECVLDETELKAWLEAIKPLIEQARKEDIGVISGRDETLWSENTSPVK